MRRASSARATWRALRSASEYTSTVRTPMARAVAAMRQAISPRLAIRILPNTSRLGRQLGREPARLALFQERGDTLFSFGRDADLGDALGRVLDHAVCNRPAARDR